VRRAGGGEGQHGAGVPEEEGHQGTSGQSAVATDPIPSFSQTGRQALHAGEEAVALRVNSASNQRQWVE